MEQVEIVGITDVLTRIAEAIEKANELQTKNTAAIEALVDEVVALKARRSNP